MVDPTRITNFDRTDDELEELILFCPAVAAKPAKEIAAKIDKFLLCEQAKVSPFEKVRRMAKAHSLMLNLQYSRLGKYGLLSKCYRRLAACDIDLRVCSVSELEAFDGIGPKTARFFVLHTRPKQRIACLDTHVLAYLRSLGHDIPKGTPTGKRYLQIEKIFLDYADASGKTPADLDLAIWNEMSKRSGTGVTAKDALNLK